MTNKHVPLTEERLEEIKWVKTYIALTRDTEGDRTLVPNDCDNAQTVELLRSSDVAEGYFDELLADYSRVCGELEHFKSEATKCAAQAEEAFSNVSNLQAKYERLCKELHHAQLDCAGMEGDLLEANNEAARAVALRTQNAVLVDALTEAKKTIRTLHGEPVWKEYQQSPEMKKINAALAANGGK